MDRYSFTLILIALATIEFSGGASNNEHCDDPVICVDKPKTYKLFKDKIEAFVKKNSDLISTKHFNALDEIEEIDSGDEENCFAVTTVEMPFVIKTNVSSEYVVQMENIFEQKIRITRCKNPYGSCFGNVKVPGFGAEAYCQEKLGAVSLYIYDPQYDQFRYKMFHIPVCCACMIRDTTK